MSVKERELHLQDMASCFIDIAEKYHHSGIFVHPNPGGLENTRRLLEIIRERSGDKFFLTMHGDPTFSIPDGDRMMDFTVSLYEKADALKEESRRRTEELLNMAAQLRRTPGLLDSLCLCSDYCFNVNPSSRPRCSPNLLP
ncbi:MAG: hypothetical protein ACLSB9_26990 [Hydrogeniiclostridium mannosilyticum]